MISTYDLGRVAYDAYCVQAGGKTFDGKPLPTWFELGNDRRLCWVAAVTAVSKEINPIK
jgi:hypothetical protein